MPQQSKQKLNSQEKDLQQVSIIDLLLFDHQYLKICIEVFVDVNADKKRKFTLAKGFLDALQKHSMAEKKAVYAQLESHPQLHLNILEAGIEHGIIDQKVKTLKAKLGRARSLKDEAEMELKVLAELLQNHLREEESEMFPKMKEVLDEATLFEIGANFMKARKLTPQNFKDYPILQDELIQWKDSVQRLSSQFLNKMDRYVEDLKH
jgi:hemerythrin-like domain-containing protein